MYKNRRELLKMIRKYLDGKATSEEKKFLDAYYSFFEKDDDIISRLEEEEKKLLKEQVRSGTWDLIEKRQEEKVRTIWYSSLRIAAAASVLLGLTIGGYFMLRPKSQNNGVALNRIQPGINGAILTLANGKKIVLEQTKNGTISEQDGSKVRKANDSLLVYKAAASAPATIAYNTLETPKGRQYAVELPDGSKVWLNAASTLKYPVAFRGKERMVELSGEGYFEVVHNAKQPFRVKTSNQLIEDIGTHFNVNAYADEPFQRTALLEGSVKIMADQSEVFIKPGQEAVLADRKLSVNEVNVQQAVAWKDGYFYFDHADIKAVMRQIARWYNVEVSYEGKLPQKRFKGKIYRNVKIEQALKILEFFNMHFRIDGNKVIVTA